jgi:anti-sigma regulatory factor (Ser/Thr protein kinase)
MSVHRSDTLVIESRLDEFARVEPWLAGLFDAWDVCPDTGFAVDLVINEAVTNVIAYAYPPATTQDIRISLTDRTDAILIEIVDSGVAFDPLEAPATVETSDLDEASIGGRGIRLIKRFADEARYDRLSGQNRLTLTIRKTGCSH